MFLIQVKTKWWMIHEEAFQLACLLNPFLSSFDKFGVRGEKESNWKLKMEFETVILSTGLRLLGYFQWRMNSLARQPKFYSNMVWLTIQDQVVEGSITIQEVIPVVRRSKSMRKVGPVWGWLVVSSQIPWEILLKVRVRSESQRYQKEPRIRDVRLRLFQPDPHWTKIY